jgi:hypothetical protein
MLKISTYKNFRSQSELLLSQTNHYRELLVSNYPLLCAGLKRALETGRQSVEGLVHDLLKVSVYHGRFWLSIKDRPCCRSFVPKLVYILFLFPNLDLSFAFYLLRMICFQPLALVEFPQPFMTQRHI